MTITQSNDIISKTLEKGDWKDESEIEDDTQKADDHILVCLSAAPSNLKIIDTAAKVANALQARFTALYVQTGTKQKPWIKKSWENISGMRKHLGQK